EHSGSYRHQSNIDVGKILVRRIRHRINAAHDRDRQQQQCCDGDRDVFALERMLLAQVQRSGDRHHCARQQKAKSGQRSCISKMSITATRLAASTAAGARANTAEVTTATCGVAWMVCALPADAWKYPSRAML